MYTNLQGCRQIVMAGLQQIGAKFASVSFSGGGDSGECDDVTIIDTANNSLCAAAKTVNVVYMKTNAPTWSKREPKIEEVRETLLDAVENLAHMELTNTNVNWYNNDGGDATWELDLKEGTQQLVVNINYTETKTAYNTGPQVIADWAQS